MDWGDTPSAARQRIRAASWFFDSIISDPTDGAIRATDSLLASGTFLGCRSRYDRYCAESCDLYFQARNGDHTPGERHIEVII